MLAHLILVLFFFIHISRGLLVVGKGRGLCRCPLNVVPWKNEQTSLITTCRERWHEYRHYFFFTLEQCWRKRESGIGMSSDISYHWYINTPSYCKLIRISLECIYAWYNKYCFLFPPDLSKHLVSDYYDVKALMDKGNEQRYLQTKFL